MFASLLHVYIQIVLHKQLCLDVIKMYKEMSKLFFLNIVLLVIEMIDALPIVVKIISNNDLGMKKIDSSYI